MLRVFLLLFLSAATSQAADLFSATGLDIHEPYRISGSGYVTDGSHPRYPGDFRQYNITFVLLFHPERGEASIDVSWDRNGKRISDHYYFRRGRIFQVNDKNEEMHPDRFGDISAVSIATMHPLLLNCALQERRDNVRQIGREQYLFAWNDELWEIEIDSVTGVVHQIKRQTYSNLLGDGNEIIRYDNWMRDSNSIFPATVSVTLRGRETASLQFEEPEKASSFEIPDNELRRERAWVIAYDEIILRKLGPHLFSIDLVSMNTRVVVAEFTEYMVVLEGAYNSRICDLIARKVTKRFAKPIRYFSFSHLHAQYLGGVRSWVSEGATVVTPPSTAPLIDSIVAATHTLHPDNLSRQPRAAHLVTVVDQLLIEDSTNALVIYNVESQHTDEYFIFYFPRHKLLMTGDLLFYRAGKSLTGRSKKLCETVTTLGLNVDTYLATWPLDGYGTKNTVSRSEMNEACAEVDTLIK